MKACGNLIKEEGLVEYGNLEEVLAWEFTGMKNSQCLLPLFSLS